MAFLRWQDILLVEIADLYSMDYAHHHLLSDQLSVTPDAGVLQAVHRPSHPLVAFRRSDMSQVATALRDWVGCSGSYLLPER